MFFFKLQNPAKYIYICQIVSDILLKKISYQTFAPPPVLKQMNILAKIIPPRTTLKFNAKFEESSLEFLHEKFLLQLMHVEEFPPIISNMYTFVHRVLFLYMKLHCAKLYFLKKNVRKEEKG